MGRLWINIKKEEDVIPKEEKVLAESNDDGGPDGLGGPTPGKPPWAKPEERRRQACSQSRVLFPEQHLRLIPVVVQLNPLIWDNQTRQVREAVSNVEKHFGELCQIFAAYVRKTARLRDKADLLVNEIHAYAATETPNLKLGLKNFANEFSKLQDYRQAEVERLEAKVVEPLKCYGTIIKLKREDLKATLTAKNREAKQLSQLERTRQRNPSDRHVINIFSEFITIEMLFHGKALEIYTAAYQSILNIDENEDLQVRDQLKYTVFRSSLYPPDHQSRLDIVLANSKSPLQRTSSSKPCAGIVQQISRNQLKKEEEEDDDDEDYDDEDEEDELEVTKEER
ncbi:hypothetical protein JD844_015960 [Phrynosoma platyrhinos]|uniref:Protein FAM92A1 n=1 Tax=Phrynosoma platyrhinos TaxID=52577 RepID=A0ABQ7SJQ7_PHRPL|nr:hypothetical protein JD844_015960 [Phrynosoma platyrhinos]